MWNLSIANGRCSSYLPQVSTPDKSAREKTIAAGSPRSELTLPQWSIDLMRPLISFGSRVLWRLQFAGLENISQSGGLIIAANHQSYGDPFWLGIPIKRPIRFLAWSEAFSWPVIGRGITLLGAWPLNVEGNPAAIRRSLTWLRGGGVIVIFPEGGRGRPDGSIIRMKGGAVRMALEAGVPILPVTIRGGNRVWPASRLLPRPGKVEIIYHPVLHVEQLPGEEARACARRETDKLAAIIASAL
jgi:1-acyl-sn-glycerol-3-phosphate acyltransferase